MTEQKKPEVVPDDEDLERFSEASGSSGERKGPLAWMAQNSVASNLLMFCVLIAGLLAMRGVKQEVFPEFELDLVTVTVLYPGASPSEVEQGVLLALEESVRGVEGVDEIKSTAAEGTATMFVSLLVGTDSDRALADIKSAIDRITSFPRDAERPIVSLATNRKEVISLVIYGDKDEASLRLLGEQLRDKLLARPDVSFVDLTAVRPLEVSIEVPQENLRRYGITLEDVAQVVRQASVDVPGGGVKTSGGEVLVRTTERRRSRDEFENIVVLSAPDGSEVRLGEIANVRDGFRETDQEAFFDGKRAVMLKAFRVGSQTPVEIATAVKSFIAEEAPKLPKGVEMAQWVDFSEWYAQRLDLLMRNAMWGLVFVIAILALFLELRLAFWVTLGIPISFVGSLVVLPQMDASINMISLFAFIVSLGMVVDDAIVIGESVFKKRREGYAPLEAAIRGVREVAVPVIFAILTTVMAFSPMLFVPGAMGKFFRLIPIVVISVLLISLMESLLILPSHLAHSKVRSGGMMMWLDGLQRRFSARVEWFIHDVYTPFVKRCLRWRYTVLAASIASLLATVGVVQGGLVKVTFLPKVEGDYVIFNLQMPFGTPVEETRAVSDKVMNAAKELLDELGGQDKLSRGMFAQVGATGAFAGGDRPSGFNPTGAHMAEGAVNLVQVDDRDFSSSEFVNKWREKVGEVPGVESLRFIYSVTGPNAGSPIEIELSHTSLEVLEDAAAELATALREFNGVYDVDDGFAPGKEQLDFRLKPAARALGLTESGLARQVRNAFFGSEAVREQRGREELRVYVRLPEEERRSEYDIENLLLKTPRGGEVPVADAATIQRGRAYTSIERRDSRRIVNVTGDVNGDVANANDILAALEADVLPKLLSRYDGLTYSFQGERKSQNEVNDSLMRGAVFALFAIFALLAVVFRSYLQPAVVMLVILFGPVGAIMGHYMLGYDLSMMSNMGIVALSGVVVNDSLILIVAINAYVRAGASEYDAIWKGAARRFRPILLTSLTTFFGLVPMISETSAQARFLVPMAISLAFGILFATLICLALVPAVCAILLDVRRGLATMGLGRPPETAALPGE